MRLVAGPRCSVKASRIGVMSCAGQLNLTAVADRDDCPGIEVVTHGARNKLDELAQPVLTPCS